MKTKNKIKKSQQTVNSFDKLYREPLQDKLFEKTNMNLYVIFVLKIWMERKRIFFKNMNIKKYKFF